MRLAVLLLSASVPVWAEMHSVEVRFDGVGCASCVESLPERLLRVRGVAEVTVDAGRGTARLRMAAGNRARLSQIRDHIQQDGTKVLTMTVDASGSVTRDGNEWVFRVDPQELRLRAGGEVREGEQRLQGIIREAAANPMVMEVIFR